MKISNQKALELLESLPLEKVSNEANFLAPLLVEGHTVSTQYTDVEGAKRRIAAALGHTGPNWEKGIWFEIQYDNQTGVHRISGTLLNDSMPVKVVS